MKTPGPANRRDIPILELDEDVVVRATYEDTMCAVPGSKSQCLGAVAAVRVGMVHGKPILDADIKMTSAYLLTEHDQYGYVWWHAIPDTHTQNLIAANDNAQYRPRPGVFRFKAPTLSQTLRANRDRARNGVIRREAKGKPPKALPTRPNMGRRFGKPRGLTAMTEGPDGILYRQ